MQKIKDFLKLLVLFAGMFVVLIFLARFTETDLSGSAKVVDGDSLHLGGEEIRLFGIDAPEYNQRCMLEKPDQSYACGKRARDYLKSLVAGQTVVCSGFERDRYDRLLAECHANGQSLNLAMIEAGWAVSFGDYYAAESRARDAAAGIWAGSFDNPAEWRKDAREAHSRGFISSLFRW